MARSCPHVACQAVLTVKASIAERTSDDGGALAYLFLSGYNVHGEANSRELIENALRHILERHHNSIEFGPCLRGAVFELRASRQPVCRLAEHSIQVDLHEHGHFHLSTGPSLKDDASPHAAVLAAFAGSAGLFGGQSTTRGFRLWNSRGEQCFNIFFDSHESWNEALRSVINRQTIALQDEGKLPAGTIAPWSRDTAEARLLFYLRLLYSHTFEATASAFEAALPAETGKLLRLVPPGIAMERRARLANLTRYLVKNTSMLGLVVDDERLRSWIEKWVSAPDFWDGRGRTLVESFCLFLYPVLRRHSRYHAEIVRLEGVLAGAPRGNDDQSPWSAPGLSLDHATRREGEAMIESFQSAFELLDCDGRFRPSLCPDLSPTGQLIAVRAERDNVTASASRADRC